MIVVRGLSPNAAYLRLLALATNHSWPIEKSRAGICRNLGAVTVELDVGQRTILLAGRGWNPAFALVEAAWVIVGRNDLQPLAELIRGFDRFSDDGNTLHGAYGHRLRHYFGQDQLELGIRELSEHTNTRRVVLSLYSPSDLGFSSKDIPCNTQIVLRRVDGRLEMTVFNRSNDLWLGVPYNWFVFWTLQCYIARRLKIQCGIQRHVSSCMHLYDDHFVAAQCVVRSNDEADLARAETNLAPLDIEGLLNDVSELADRSFDHLSSAQLANAFKQYFQYCRGGQVTALPPALDVLATSLDLWNSARRSLEVNTVSNTTLNTNNDTETHLRIQRWVLATDPATAVEVIDKLALRAFPKLCEALKLELGLGVTIGFESSAAQHQATLHFVLELILGTLDPELVRTSIGDHLRDRIRQIASIAGLPLRTYRSREMSEQTLLDIFQDALNMPSST